MKHTSLVEMVLECDLKKQDPFHRRIIDYISSMIAEDMASYLVASEEYCLDRTTTFYEMLLGGGDDLEKKALGHIMEFRNELVAKRPPGHEAALSLLDEAEAHARGRYTEPDFARLLYAAASMQSAEMIAQAGYESIPPSRPLSQEASLEFMKVFAALQGVKIIYPSNGR